MSDDSDNEAVHAANGDRVDPGDDDRRRLPPPILAAGATGAVAGAVGASELIGETAIAVTSAASAASAPTVGLGPAGVTLGPGAVGPTGVSLGQTAAVGPMGVPVGSTAVGPGGVPLAQTAVGPGGVPLGGGSGVATRGLPMKGLRAAMKAHRAAAIVGSAVVVAVAVGAIALATHDDTKSISTASPTTVEALVQPASIATIDAPVTTAVSVAAATTEAATTAVQVTEPATTEAPTTTTPGVGSGPGAACAIGTWTANNNTLAAALFGASSLGGLPLENLSTTGVVHVVINADGSEQTSYDGWKVTASIDSATASMSVTGSESSTVRFNDDGTISVTNFDIGTHLVIDAGGTVVADVPNPEGIFRGPGTYTCAGDTMVIVETGTILSNQDFTRGG